jgi:MoaA/NifB/PqqE/SkfB family radical SAM enzyme
VSLEQTSILDRWRSLSIRECFPIQASLELTYRCNQRCQHCYLESHHDDTSRILGLMQWKHILGQLRKAGTLWLTLMGGEAMLHPNFFEIAEEATKQGFHLSLITNGLDIKTRAIAHRLKSAGVKQVTLSLYSLDESVHDRMTGLAGSHKRTKKALRYCLEEKIPVGINCLLTSQNIEKWPELATFCRAKDIPLREDFYVTPKTDGNMSPTNLRPTGDQITNYLHRKKELWPNFKIRPLRLMGDHPICNMARGRCAVNAYGDLLACLEVRRPLGNLLKESFQRLWNNKKANELRSLSLKDMKWEVSGTHQGFCDHCPGIAMIESNDPLKPTEYVLAVAQIKAALNEAEKQ